MEKVYQSFNAQDFAKIAEAVQNAIAELQTLLEASKEIAVKFNGKVLNKRFADAINATAQNWVLLKKMDDFKRWEFYLYKNRYVQIYSICHYINEHIYSTIWDCKILGENGRICADEWIKACDKLSESLTRQARTFADAVEHFAEYKKQAQELQKEIERKTMEMHPFFRDTRPNAYGFIEKIPSAWENLHK